MPAIFEYRLTVPDDAIDGLGHANNTVFFQWMQAAAIAHSTEQGWSPESYHERGIAWIARSHAIQYRRPAFAGDRIVVQTWVNDMHRVSSRREYRIYRESSTPVDTNERDSMREADSRDLIARAHTKWVLIDLKSGSLKRIPADMAAAFESVDLQ